MSERTVWRDRSSRHSFAREPGNCARCGLELEPAGERRLYCDVACRKAVQEFTLAERAARRQATPAGSCANCGMALEPVVSWRCPRWRRHPELARMRRRAGGVVRFGGDGWTWLASKLGLPADDERLPDLAMRLAEAGRLHVFIARNGTPIAVGKVKANGPKVVQEVGA